MSISVCYVILINLLIGSIIRELDSRKNELKNENNSIRSMNEEVIEQIEIHEETKKCIEGRLADQSSISSKMLLTTETVNAKIKETSATYEDDLRQMDEIIESSKAQLQQNFQTCDNFHEKMA